jgi:hypothetical protein
MKKQMQISGTYKFGDKSGLFTGTVTFDERENMIYYGWGLRDEQGNNLGSKARPILFQQIPAGQDKLEFSKAHALEGIRRFRIGRERIVQTLNVLE